MVTNVRFREEAAGLLSEALAEDIRISWNPVTDDATINFRSTRYLRSGDIYISRMEGDNSVSLTGDELSARSYEIDGKVITGADVNIFTRLLYDEVYNELYGQPFEETGTGTNE